MLEVVLESNEIYDFYNIRSVEIRDWDKIIIEGNFDKGRRYKKIELNGEMIRNFNKFLKTIDEKLTEFEYKGLCPFCDSKEVYEVRDVKRYRHINKRNEIRYENDISSSIIYRCKTCNSEFKPNNLKECNIIKYD